MPSGIQFTKQDSLNSRPTSANDNKKLSPGKSRPKKSSPDQSRPNSSKNVTNYDSKNNDKKPLNIKQKSKDQLFIINEIDNSPDN